MDGCYTLEAPCAEQDQAVAVPVAFEEQGAALSDVTEHAVTVDVEPEVVLVTAGEQGPPGAPGPGAFAAWLERNPGGTFEQFMSELGSGAIWQTTEW